MRPLARTLLVVLGLLASCREAASAACASTCVGRPWNGVASAIAGIGAARCDAPKACSPAACCSPCDEPALPCPLLEATPQAVVERAPTPRALPEPVVLPSFAAVPFIAPILPHLEATSEEPPACGVRPRAGPLWLRDLRLLI